MRNKRRERVEKFAGAAAKLPAEILATLPVETRKGLANLAKAFGAAASRTGGNCEWRFVAGRLFSRLEEAGLNVSQVHFRGGWRDRTGFPFYRAEGNGEFALFFFPVQKKGTGRAVEKIRETLWEMEEENLLEIEDAEETNGEGLAPFWWLKAKFLNVR